MRGALQHFHGKQARGRRMAAGIVELAGDVGAQGHPGVGQGVELLQGLQPHIEGSPENRGIKSLLRTEVIKEVRLREARRNGDLVDSSPLESVSRKDFKRRIEDALRVRFACSGLARRRAPAHPYLVSHRSPLSHRSLGGPYGVKVCSARASRKASITDTPE
jgi:hypothetical protein